jgi:flagellar protein FlaG
MNLEVKTSYTYQDMTTQAKKLSEDNLNGQVPNISLSDKALPEVGENRNNKDNNEESTRMMGASENQIKSAISQANSQLRFTSTRCEFSYYEDINRVAIKVIDRYTDKVIREIPPEETIELVQKLWEFAGLLYDEKG